MAVASLLLSSSSSEKEVQGPEDQYKNNIINWIESSLVAFNTFNLNCLLLNILVIVKHQLNYTNKNQTFAAQMELWLCGGIVDTFLAMGHKPNL